MQNLTGGRHGTSFEGDGGLGDQDLPSAQVPGAEPRRVGADAGGRAPPTLHLRHTLQLTDQMTSNFYCAQIGIILSRIKACFNFCSSDIQISLTKRCTVWRTL